MFCIVSSFWTLDYKYIVQHFCFVSMREHFETSEKSTEKILLRMRRRKSSPTRNWNKKNCNGFYKGWGCYKNWNKIFYILRHKGIHGSTQPIRNITKSRYVRKIIYNWWTYQSVCVYAVSVHQLVDQKSWFRPSKVIVLVGKYRNKFQHLLIDSFAIFVFVSTGWTQSRCV